MLIRLKKKCYSYLGYYTIIIYKCSFCQTEMNKPKPGNKCISCKK